MKHTTDFQGNKQRSSNENIIKVLVILLVLCIGGAGLKAGIYMQEMYGPNRSTERRYVMQKMLREQVEDKKISAAL